MKDFLYYDDHIKNLKDKGFPLYFCRHYVKYSEKIDMHYHTAFEIGYCYEGKCDFYFDKDKYEVKKGMGIIAFPNQIHIANGIKNEPISKWLFLNVEMENILLGEDALKWWKMLKLNRSSIPFAFDDDEVTGIIKSIFDCITENTVKYKTTVRILLLCLIALLTEKYVDNKNGLHNTKTNPLEPAFNLMYTGYKNKITVADLANACNMSESTFRKRFFDEAGQTPHEFLTKIRMIRAKELLDTRIISVEDASKSVGYGSASAFISAYKNYFGTTPKG